MKSAARSHSDVANVSRDELVDMIIILINGTASTLAAADDEIEAIRSYLHRFGSETLNQIVSTMSSSKSKLQHTPLISFITDQAPPSTLREYLYFRASLPDTFWPRVPMLIKGLHYVEQLPEYEDYSLAPQHVREQCNALLAATDFLFTSNPSAFRNNAEKEYHLSDASLVKLILERYAEIELILTAFNEERTSVDSVRAYLDNPAPVLATGTL